MAADLGVTGTGKEQVAVFLQTEDGHNITWYGYFTDKTVERTLETLKLCGWDSDDISDLDGIDGSAVVDIVVENEEYEERVRSRVRWINSPGGGGPALKDKMDEGSRASFAERMKGKVLAFNQQNPSVKAVRNDDAPPPPQQDGGASSPLDPNDDIPF